MEVSAKTAHNVEDAFTCTAKQILENIDNNKSDIQNKGMILEKDKQKKSEINQNCNC